MVGAKGKSLFAGPKDPLYHNVSDVYLHQAVQLAKLPIGVETAPSALPQAD
jgi:hypothetical protein